MTLFPVLDEEKKKTKKKTKKKKKSWMKTKQHGARGGQYLLKTPGNAISETLNFRNVPRCLSPQELVPLV